MRNVIKFSFFFIVFFICLSLPVFAIDFTGGLCTGDISFWATTAIYTYNNSSGTPCSNFGSPPPISWNTMFGTVGPGNCCYIYYDCTAALQSGGQCAGMTASQCILPVMRIVMMCPNNTDYLQMPSLELSQVACATVTNVPMGEEKFAAETYCNSFSSSTQYVQSPEGFARTDGLNGYSYTTSMSPGSNILVDVKTCCWKRGGYTKNGGNVVPLENIPGGGTGGTSLTPTDIINGVQGGVDASSLPGKLDGIQTAISGVGDAISGIGDGLTESQFRSAVAGGVGDALGTASGSVSGSPGVTPSDNSLSSYNPSNSYISDRLPLLEHINFSQRVTDFYNDMKAAPFFSKLSLTPLAGSGGGSSSMTVSFGSFGDVNFDLANYAGTYNYIRGFLLLLGSYIALRVVILRR